MVEPASVAYPPRERLLAMLERSATIRPPPCVWTPWPNAPPASGSVSRTTDPTSFAVLSSPSVNTPAAALPATSVS
jgi:hypothetical protein